MNILRPCQHNWITFTCLTPVEPKIWPLTFSNYEMVRRRSVKPYFFSESFKQEESVGMGLDNVEATFEFDPCTNYLVTPGFLYRM